MTTGPIHAGPKEDIVFAVTRGALFKILLVMLMPGIGFCFAGVGMWFTVQQHGEELREIKGEQREIRRDVADLKTTRKP